MVVEERTDTRGGSRYAMIPRRYAELSVDDADRL